MITYMMHIYFQQSILASSYGREARDYLSKRGITEEVIKEFEIGLSLDKKNDLTNLLINKKYDLKTLNEIGLSIDDRDIYIDRIMFPLYDTYGKIVGFSGRIYNENKQNKYINTKETSIFKKGHCLYHYHIAKDTCRVSKSVIIMEGFMDVIRASTIGIKNTVALMGTALTKEQIMLIKRLSNNVILCLDGDSPGVKASLKIGEVLQNEGLNVKVVTLPNDDDPDTFILTNGKERFQGLIDAAVNFGDYKIDSLKNNVDFNSESSLAEYINSVLEETIKINDEIRVEIILKKLAKDYNIGYNTLEKRFKELKKDTKASKIEIKKEPKKKRKDKYSLAVEQLIYYMLNNDWVVTAVENEKIIFPSNEARLLTSEVIYYYKKHGEINIADFYTYMQDKTDLLDLLNEIVSNNYKETITKDELFAYFKVIREYSMNEQIKRLEKKIKEEPDIMEQARISEQIRKLKLGE